MRIGVTLPFLKTNNNDLFHLPFGYTPPQSYISQLNYFQDRNKEGHLNSQGANHIHHLTLDCNSSICKCAPHIIHLCLEPEQRSCLLNMAANHVHNLDKNLNDSGCFLLFCRSSFHRTSRLQLSCNANFIISTEQIVYRFSLKRRSLYLERFCYQTVRTSTNFRAGYTSEINQTVTP